MHVQALVQQQLVVRAVQMECRLMQQEASRQASAMQLLESMADKHRMKERSLEHHFWEASRQSLGAPRCHSCPLVSVVTSCLVTS